MRARHLWVATLSFAGVAGATGALAEGCVSSSNGGAAGLDASFDGNVISTFDAAGLDVNQIPGADGGGGGDGAPGADGGVLADSGPLDAAPQLLASNLAAPPGRIVVGGGYVFWVPNPSSGPVSSDLDVLDLADGGITTITNISGVTAVTADSTAAYWVTATDLYALAFGSATPQEIGNAVVPATTVYGLTSDGTNLYWVQSAGLYRFPVAGGASKATTLLDGLTNPEGFVLEGTNVYFGIAGPGAAGGGSIASLPQSDLGVDASAAAAVPIVSGQTLPLFLASDGAHVLWVSNAYPSSVYSADFDGGSLVQYPSTTVQASFVSDDTSVYWPAPGTLSDGGPGSTIQKAPIGNATATATLYLEDAYIEWVAVDGTWIYWVDAANNRIYRAPK